MTEMDPHVGIDSPVAYLRTKAQAEVEVEVERGLSRSLDTVILQPTYAIGRYDTKNWGRLFRVIPDGKTGGAPRGAGTFVLAEAVGRAHVAAANRGRKGSKYILSSMPATFQELFTVAQEPLGINSRLKPAPAVLVTALGWIFQGLSMFSRRAPDLTPEVAYLLNNTFYYDGRVAMDELGLQTVDIRSMLKDFFDWLKSQGRI